MRKFTYSLCLITVASIAKNGVLGAPAPPEEVTKDADTFYKAVDKYLKGLTSASNDFINKIRNTLKPLEGKQDFDVGQVLQVLDSTADKTIVDLNSKADKYISATTPIMKKTSWPYGDTTLSWYKYYSKR